MRHLKKFKCAICGCESANFNDGGRYCQKCKLIYGEGNLHGISVRIENDPKFRISKFFRDTVDSMSTLYKLHIAEQLGGFPKTYNEQSKLDAKRVGQAKKDTKKLSISKSRAKCTRSDFKICACCGERFIDYSNGKSKHCAVCWNVFGAESLKSIDKLSDSLKCELYKIHRAKCSDEIKSITPQELHQNLVSKLNIRFQSPMSVVAIRMRTKLAAQAIENEKHKKNPFTCCKCGGTYLLEGEHPKPFICNRCKVYEEEHRKGTKLRKLPGLPSMTYEHLALLPEYAACMFTKHMTAEELEKLKEIKAKVKPSRKTFSEHLAEV